MGTRADNTEPERPCGGGEFHVVRRETEVRNLHANSQRTRDVNRVQRPQAGGKRIARTLEDLLVQRDDLEARENLDSRTTDESR